MANIGISLELACDRKISQSTLISQKNLPPQPYALLEQDVGPDTTLYSFPFKLGDHDRLHDGLIGYFRAYSNPGQHVGKELDTSKFYTSYVDPDGVLVFPISNSGNYKYPTLSAFWLDPPAYQDPEATLDDHYIGTAKKYEDARNDKLVENVFGCIMDPFVPVNIYTSILPVQPLTLPNWTWESALKTMTAFFHFGPLMVTDDVASYSPPNPTAEATDESTTSAVKLPSLKVADWSWLQPYYPDAQTGSEFTPLDVGQIDSRPRYEKGPYTAVEGYLQMKSSMLVDK